MNNKLILEDINRIGFLMNYNIENLSNDQIISSIDGYVDCTIINLPMSRKSRQSGFQQKQTQIKKKLNLILPNH